MKMRNNPPKIPVSSPGTAIYPKGIQKVQDILTTAAEVLADEGYSGFTMRNIASRLGITLRNLQYYFPTKRDLFQAVVEKMTDMELETAALAVESPGLNAEERLSTFIDYSIKDNETPLVRGFQFELWALATRDDFAAECRDRMTSTYCEYIYTLVKPLTPGLSSREQRIKSALILAMLQGTPLIHSEGVNRKYQIKNIAVKVKQEVLNILHN